MLAHHIHDGNVVPLLLRPHASGGARLALDDLLLHRSDVILDRMQPARPDARVFSMSIPP